ncbi:MAG: glycosyltransferase [Thermodesulfobacteriota bacterium]|nr:glycosyltransferase [Thermodesulfobacteriota bacterium]
MNNSNVKRKLIFILPSLESGGAETVILNLIAHLDRALYSAELLVLDGKGPLKETVPSHVVVHDLETPRLRHAIFKIIKIIRSQRPELIISSICHINIALLALRPLFFRKNKVIVRESNTPSKRLASLPFPALFKTGYRLFYPKADKVLCLSKQMADEIIRDYHVLPDRIEILWNPANVKKIRSLAGTPIRIPGKGIRFVAAGRLIEQKGFDRLIEMLASISCNVHLTILGHGPQKKKLHDMITHLGLEEKVRLAGFTKNPWAYYAGADAFLLSSRWEGMPNAALEALACGTRVIATPEAGAIDEVAQMTKPGSVTLAETGAPFVRVMESVQPDLISTPRKTLLPSQFFPESVLKQFSKILESIF